MEVQRPLMQLAIESSDLSFMERARNYSNEIFGPNLLRSNDSKSDALLSPAQFGCLTGLLIILFSNYQVDKEKCLNRLWFLLSSPKLKEFLLTIICFAVMLVLMPTTLLTFAAFWIYRHCDGLKLRKSESAKFKGFLNGEDIVWACEDSVSKSIINILAFVRAPNAGPLSALPQNLLNSIRDRIQTKLVLTNRFPKMFYRRRKSDSGYFYWTDENPLTVTDYVRFSEEKSSSGVKSEGEFKREMSELVNEPLPAGNTALWECLIGKEAIRVEDALKFPIIFRVHHSVGDGVALLRLLLESLSDEVEFDVTSDNPLLGRKERLVDRMTRYYINLVTAFRTPYTIVRMSLKQIDMNQIHPASLSGNKKVNWLYESDSNGRYPTLLTVVKLLKRQCDGARFSNILLAALAKSLRDFMERKNFPIPKDMTVVVPARLYSTCEDPQLRLENKFSVALMTLPIEEMKVKERIMRIKEHSDEVNASADYLVNYWMMTLVSAVFPEWVLKVIMNSKHCTLAVSNLPGPNFTIKINGHEFENVGFFLPNIGQTACGVTILSYNNKLHFGIMTDENAIGSGEELGEILDGMVGEIEKMTKTILN